MVYEVLAGPPDLIPGRPLRLLFRLRCLLRLQRPCGCRDDRDDCSGCPGWWQRRKERMALEKLLEARRDALEKELWDAEVRRRARELIEARACPTCLRG